MKTFCESYTLSNLTKEPTESFMDWFGIDK